jgi:hypothetical protein
MADIGIYDGKTVKGPLDSGDGSKSSYVGKTGWPTWAGTKVLSTNGFSFNLDDRDMDDSESEGYLVDSGGGICHLGMENVGGSNIDSNMYFMFDLKTVLTLNSKFKINSLRGVPKNPKELFLLAQLCHVCHYALDVADEAEKGSRNKDVWNNASNTMKQLAVDVYTMHNGSSYAKRLFPQGINTISEEKRMSGKEFAADDGVSAVPAPITPEGGEGKKDKLKKTTTDEPKGAGEKVKTPATEEFETVEEIVIESSIESIIEGEDLSEDFKSKIALVFEAALNEEVNKREEIIREELTKSLDATLEEAVTEKLDTISENVDKYLDYVVTEWMSENEIAIEAGIKVEMAESLMTGLKNLFVEHNVNVSEETVDVVANLEISVTELEWKANDLVNENIELQKEIATFKAGQKFDELSEGLSANQVERLKVLSEKLDVVDLDAYAENLTVIKESFFGDKLRVEKHDVQNESDEIILEEQEVIKPSSDYASINSLVEAFNTKK